MTLTILRRDRPCHRADCYAHVQAVYVDGLQLWISEQLEPSQMVKARQIDWPLIAVQAPFPIPLAVIAELQLSEP
jgi:hypothetical protein